MTNPPAANPAQGLAIEKLRLLEAHHQLSERIKSDTVELERVSARLGEVIGEMRGRKAGAAEARAEAAKPDKPPTEDQV
jgi:hypothetical protein